MRVLSSPAFSFVSSCGVCIRAEGKIIMYSNSYAALTPCAEALRCLLFPFKWQCVFIPILPSTLAYTIRAPVPFCVGLHRYARLRRALVLCAVSLTYLLFAM
jgi:hypothetical protein